MAASPPPSLPPSDLVVVDLQQEQHKPAAMQVTDSVESIPEVQGTAKRQGMVVTFKVSEPAPCATAVRVVCGGGGSQVRLLTRPATHNHPPTRPRPPARLQDVSYTVQNRADKKTTLTLLDNISGFFTPGTITALQGPSGSGKTTLLGARAGPPDRSLPLRSGSVLASCVHPYRHVPPHTHTHADLLAGRKTTGKQTGEIRFGGVKPTTTFLRRWTGYVEQFDTLVPNLTVFENLMLVRGA